MHVKKILITLLIATSLFGAPVATQKGKLFVSDVQGEVVVKSVDVDGKILTPKLTFVVEGSNIQSPDNGNCSVVYSNGTGMYVSKNTQVVTEQFTQEPFSTNRNSVEVEPSVSRLRIRLDVGSIGICTSRLVSGSVMQFVVGDHVIYITPNGKISIDVSTSTLYVIDGTVLVQQSKESVNRQIQIGKKVKLDGSFKMETPTEQELRNAEDQVTLACMARSSVMFDTDGTEIVPIDVTPVDPPITVSPATIQ